jgi:hemerythrin superfamily protein
MAKSKKSRRQAAGGNGSSSMKKQGGATDAEALLKQDHRNVEKLFTQFESAEEARKEEIVAQVCRELILHAVLEEEVFYPACRDKGVEDDMLDEAQVEHDSVKLLVNDLMQGRRGPYYDAKVMVLAEYVKHHVKEEEKKGSGIFAKARKAGVDLAGLGQRLQEFKQRIEDQAGSEGLPLPRLRALGMQSERFNRNQQEVHMERDRDERGRFTDDDNGRGGRGGGRGQGRGWFGDSEGHSRAAQQRGFSSGRYDDEDDRGGRFGRGGSRERDEQGRFMSDEDNGRRGGGGRGQGGWFGDSEGHSRAAQQRGSSSGRYDDEDDRGGRFGRGGSRERDEQGRFMSDDDDNGGRGGGRGHGRGGWFGDSEGHSRAAQQRGSSSGRYDDDDVNGGRGGRGGGRGGSRERDEQGRFMSDEDNGVRGGGGRGQGGWFGDPRGHSEASRRGWRDRD